MTSIRQAMFVQLVTSSLLKILYMYLMPSMYPGLQTRYRIDPSLALL